MSKGGTVPYAEPSSVWMYQVRSRRRVVLKNRRELENTMGYFIASTRVRLDSYFHFPVAATVRITLAMTCAGKRVSLSVT